MPRQKKRHAVVGVFETRARADQATSELRRAGFDDSEIGMVYRDQDGKTVKTGAADDTYAEEGAVTGAVAGAAGGALIGAGIAAGVIPVIGPVLAVGTLGTILLNAAGGAALAGLTGALVGWGIPEEDATFYENEVKSGRYLVVVDTKDRRDEARRVLHGRGGFDRTGWAAVRADRANIASEGSFRTEDGRTFQLREEHLKPEPREEKTGDVKAREDVVTGHGGLTVPVDREEVVIERRPTRGGRATGDLNDQGIRIEVREEKGSVSEAVAKEDVNAGKQKVRDAKTGGGDVRREESSGARGRRNLRTDRK